MLCIFYNSFLFQIAFSINVLRVENNDTRVLMIGAYGDQLECIKKLSVYRYRNAVFSENIGWFKYLQRSVNLTVMNCLILCIL